jgi:GntR family transcriptional regulator/MocR family aminotransferase
MHVHDILAAIPLERASATPLFRQLYLQMKEAILAGGIAPSARLPATRELGRLLQVSRQTVLAAYEQLMVTWWGRWGRGRSSATRCRRRRARPGPGRLKRMPCRRWCARSPRAAK